jgi:hypothetical protein
LQWIEVERAAVSAMPPPSPAGAPSRDVLPSLNALRSLEDQIHAGYIRGVHKALDQIAIAEPQCEAFVLRLRGMAKQFQLDAMAHVLQESLTQAQSQA